MAAERRAGAVLRHQNGRGLRPHLGLVALEPLHRVGQDRRNLLHLFELLLPGVGRDVDRSPERGDVEVRLRVLVEEQEQFLTLLEVVSRARSTGAERGTAERLIRLVNGPLPWPSINADKAIPWIEQRTGLELAATQKAAIRLALAAKVRSSPAGPASARRPSSRPFCAF